MWIYPIGDSYSADQECQDWYRRNEPLKEERLSGFQRLPQCPCSWWWLWGNWRWAYWRDGYNVMCFRMTVGRSRQLAPYGKVGGHMAMALTQWMGWYTMLWHWSFFKRLADTVLWQRSFLIGEHWPYGEVVGHIYMARIIFQYDPMRRLVEPVLKHELY